MDQFILQKEVSYASDDAFSTTFIWSIDAVFQVQKRSNFIDTARVRIKAGGGGNGLPQYGGAGGRGSNMYLQANGEVTLKKFLQKCPNKRIGGINGTPSK